MLSLSHIFIDGAILSLILGVLIFGSLIYNPRLWLQDYPAPVRALVPPLTPTEKRVQKLFMIPFLLLMLGVPLLSALDLRAVTGGSLPFGTAYLHIFFVLNLFNLFDAVVIDLLVLTFLKPAFMILPGTQAEHYVALNDWGLHLRNYIKGVVFCALASLPLALVVSL